MSDTSQAEAIERAVEGALAALPAAPVMSAEAALDVARGIYCTWRNAHLGGLAPSEFQKIEASSGALISAIAAALT